MVDETAKLIAERISTYSNKNIVVVAPETAPIAIAHILRSQYNISVQNVGKKKRPHMGPETIREDYSAVTSTTSNSLYFSGMDEEINFDQNLFEVVLFDNVVTSGGTFSATARLLKRYYPKIKIAEAIVMWTEGYNPFFNICVEDDWKIPIHSLGGHIPIISEKNILHSEELRPPLFYFKSSARFPTYYSQQQNIQFSVFESTSQALAVAVIGPNTFQGTPNNGKWEGITVRVHDACLTSECFQSCKCDCREQLEQAMTHICTKGGMLIYLFQEGRGIGLVSKLKAYYLQTMAVHDTVEANLALELPDDSRSYIAVRDILNHFHIGSINLMSNNPRKTEQLTLLGVKVIGRVSAEVEVVSSIAARYQLTKALEMGHSFSSDYLTKVMSLNESNINVILFYEPDEEYGFLSNFYPSPIVVESIKYPTVEHYYQSRKFISKEKDMKMKEIYDLICSSPTPAECFKIARENDHLKRIDWDIHKKRDMFRGIIFKFKQHSELREKLLATGDATLIENSKVDSFWGCGSDGKGNNFLGRMLCNIRLALREHVFDFENPLSF